MRVQFPEEYSPERALILALLHSAIRDYFYPEKIPTPHFNTPAHRKAARERYQELARRFLFEDSYLIDWGDTPLSTSSLLELVDLDLKEIRTMVLLKKEKGTNKNSRAPLLGEIE